MNAPLLNAVSRGARWRRITPWACALAAGIGLAGCKAAPPASDQPSEAAGAVTDTLGAGAGATGVDATPTFAGPSGAATAASTTLSADDEAQMVALVRSVFGAAAGSAEPDMQNVVVAQMTTPELRVLRGDATPDASAIGYSAGYIWVVGFKTGLPLTLSTFTTPENMRDLKGIGPTDSLAGPDGLTSLYYVVATQNAEGQRRFVPLSQGILVPGKSKWTLDDLSKAAN